MKQEFNLSVKDSNLFLKYFNAAMRDPVSGFIRENGNAHFKDGKYIIEQSVNFLYENKNLFVAWRIILNSDNSLKSIENTNNINNGEYESTLYKFINDILQNVIGKKKSSYFKRVYYKTISGCNLPGEYWLPGFRFAPLFADDNSHLVNAERIIVIDQNVEAIDIDHANQVALENASRYSAYLSFILDLGFYMPRHEELYFSEIVNDSFLIKRMSTQLVDVDRPIEMPLKEQICPLADYKDSVFDDVRYCNEYLVCPKETRKIIKGIEKASEESRDAFLRCCLLYQLGLNAGRYQPTVRLSYFYGAIDSIVKTNKRKYKSFTDFMTKYAGEDKKFYDFIHGNIRSAHWHSGGFVLGDFNFDYDFLTNPDLHRRHDIVDIAHKKMRKAILMWLKDEVKII